MLNIDEELKKIKQLLEKTITLGVEIVPNYDFGNKISIKCYKMIDNKMTKYEYSFSIRYFKDKDNYANAPYLLDCDYDYNLGGGGYADKYESIEDFKNTSMYKELLENYGRDKKQVENNKTEELTLFDTEEDIEEEIEEDIEDNETLDVSNDNQMSIFEMEEFNQLSMFNEIEDNNVDLKDLMSYGVDDYYNKWLKGETLGVISKNVHNVPKYDEYYNKLKEYLKKYLPVKDYDTTGWSFTGKCMFIEDEIIIVRGNRQQCPVYCYSMIPNGIID